MSLSLDFGQRRVKHDPQEVQARHVGVRLHIEERTAGAGSVGTVDDYTNRNVGRCEAIEAPSGDDEISFLKHCETRVVLQKSNLRDQPPPASFERTELLRRQVRHDGRCCRRLDDGVVFGFTKNV